MQLLKILNLFRKKVLKILNSSRKEECGYTKPCTTLVSLLLLIYLERRGCGEPCFPATANLSRKEGVWGTLVPHFGIYIILLSYK
jgi:hypothetical protein